eukprot:2796205-Prymnesium_polylepis.1
MRRHAEARQREVLALEQELSGAQEKLLLAAAAAALRQRQEDLGESDGSLSDGKEGQGEGPTRPRLPTSGPPASWASAGAAAQARTRARTSRALSWRPRSRRRARSARSSRTSSTTRPSCYSGA